jgi:hypothetical protein
MSRYFTDEFLETLPNETWAGLEAICNKFTEFDSALIDSDLSSGDHIEYYNEYIDALAIIEAFSRSKGLKVNAPEIQTKDVTINSIRHFIYAIQKEVEQNVGKVEKERARDRFARHFEGAFHYKFTEGDITRIQTILNGLRSCIAVSTILETDLKARILARLEKL